MADPDEGVAVGQLPDGVTIGQQITARTEDAPIRRDFFRGKRQPQQFRRFRRSVKSGIFDTPGAVANGIHHRAGADDMVLPAGAKLLGKPADSGQQPAKWQRMGDVQPTAVDNDAAINVVFGHPGLMDIVGLEDHLAIGEFTRPRIVCRHAILRQGPADEQRRIPKRAPAA